MSDYETKPRVALIYELINRDLLPTLYLKQILESRGFACHLVPQRLLTVSRLLKVKPDIVIVDGIRSLHNYLSQVKYCKSKYGSRVISLYSEQVGGQTSLAHQYGNKIILDNVDAHIVWSRLFRDDLIRAGANPNNVHAVGSHRLDLTLKFDANIQRIRTELGRRYNIDPNKRWVVVADNIIRMHSKDDHARRRDFDIVTMEIVKNLNKDIEVLFKFHPNTSKQVRKHVRSIYKSSRVTFLGDEHISMISTQITDMVIHNSTSAVDALVLGKNVYPVCTPAKNKTYWYDQCLQPVHAMGINQVINNINNMRSIENSTALSWIAKWYGDIDGNSGLRIADIVDDVLDIKQSDTTVRVSKREIVKIHAREIVKILVKAVKGNSLDYYATRQKLSQCQWALSFIKELA